MFKIQKMNSILNKYSSSSYIIFLRYLGMILRFINKIKIFVLTIFFIHYFRTNFIQKLLLLFTKSEKYLSCNSLNHILKFGIRLDLPKIACRQTTWWKALKVHVFHRVPLTKHFRYFHINFHAILNYVLMRRYFRHIISYSTHPYNTSD